MSLTMSRLSSSTYSSLCLLLFLHFVWLLLLTTTPGAEAKPTDYNYEATSSPSPSIVSKKESTHIVSFVNLKKAQRPREEFDFKRNEAEANNSMQVQQLFGSLLLLQGPSNNSLDTDDAPATKRNTLDDELSLDDPVGEQHESSTETPDAWNRIKLAIPVLEPVKHLLNAVGGGGVNDTHVRTNTHRLIGHHGVHHTTHHSGNESSAIETEEDRETAIESNGFNTLESLGMLGTMLWGILQNLRSVFAASAGNASSAFSGGGGGNHGSAGDN
ncbi:uncharacterized protein LOC133835738 [Drosophila sulfurigaster albostrigata]|uniref:uncharacterized protein LOC133835738 n=1 Tax=Drosophila sulfurigaster albostrigata TaxID=89887 RepID=UPI002D21C07D|nr:uncharacterized protein LOC133835738 [Drosophila sulfurigaster albostrigata]